MQDRRKGPDGEIITNKQCQNNLKDFWKVASITSQWNGCKLKKKKKNMLQGQEMNGSTENIEKTFVIPENYFCIMLP